MVRMSAIKVKHSLMTLLMLGNATNCRTQGTGESQCLMSNGLYAKGMVGIR